MSKASNAHTEMTTMSSKIRRMARMASRQALIRGLRAAQLPPGVQANTNTSSAYGGAYYGYASQAPAGARMENWKVTLTFQFGRTDERIFATRAEADAYAAQFETWAYVARIRIAPVFSSTN
jgi:hypothetical protein